MNLTTKDFEKIQLALAQHQLDYRMELENGRIIIMGLSDYLSEEVIAALVTSLRNWVVPRRLGCITGSGAGFRLPNATNDLRGPDVSLISSPALLIFGMIS